MVIWGFFSILSCGFKYLFINLYVFEIEELNMYSACYNYKNLVMGIQ